MSIATADLLETSAAPAEAVPLALGQSGPETPTGIWARLKAGTRAVHGQLDGRIMQGRPFESQERYGRFLQVQHDFHVLVSPLFQRPDLAPLLPDLRDRDRLALIEADLLDLDISVPERQPHTAEQPVDVPTALGWLYVAEGSNLGAAFLLKAAREIGLSETFGARHLAAAPEGRGLHWKTFTAALDAIALSAEDEARVIAGANEAFSRVLAAVEARFFGTTG